MPQSVVRPGRPVWLEFNAQRVTAGIKFYQELYGWTSRPLHVPPWGALLHTANGDRVFGTQFMAMGAFALPKWMIWFSADLERAEPLIEKLGGGIGQGIHQLGNLGRLLDASDPDGNSFSLINLQHDPPADDQCGDPCLAEFWGPEASALSEFYAEVMGLECTRIPTGAMLSDDGVPRLFFRDTPFAIYPSRWIVYFRTSSAGGDSERARRAGAVVQVHQEKVPQLGELVVLDDPAGAYFGLVDIDQA